MHHDSEDLKCDVLIIGSGAGGLSCAITAAKNGLKPIVIEKSEFFGGTTAFSGGVLWIPGSDFENDQNPTDNKEAVYTYLKTQIGEKLDQEAISAFLDKGPEMVRFFEKETNVSFVPTRYPDYNPNMPGGADIGRSIMAAPYDIRALGTDIKRLRPPLDTITFIGMMFNSSNADLKHFFNATRSLRSFAYVLKRLTAHIKELALYRRGINVTSGNALAARLAKTALDLNIPILTSAPASHLIREKERVIGAEVTVDGTKTIIHAQRAVVLACGGFPHDIKRIKQIYPHLRAGGEHYSPVPETNTGDGLAMAESIGVKVECNYPNTSAWMPTSLVPQKDGSFKKFPHLLDRAKPGVIGVTSEGHRFCNESDSYHNVGEKMVAFAGKQPVFMWLICDSNCLRKYGLGIVKPFPIPHGIWIKKGYLKKGNTIEDLAKAMDVSPKNLVFTISEYNKGAAHGRDDQFGRGSTTFNRYLADPDNTPNPCVNPMLKAPFYAVKVYMGDLGTFDGIRTDVYGGVLDTCGQSIPGLYAVGNDRRSIMGGSYPAAGITLGPIMTFGYITGRHLAGIDDTLCRQTQNKESIPHG